jgi:hypothetical protein
MVEEDSDRDDDVPGSKQTNVDSGSSDLHQGEAELRVDDIQSTEQGAAALGSGTLDEESRSRLSGTESEDEVDLRHLRRSTVATAIHTDNPVECRNGLASHPLQDPASYKEDSLSGLTSHALPPRSIPEALARSDAAHWKEAIDQEILSCIKYQVWEECALPKGKHA